MALWKNRGAGRGGGRKTRRRRRIMRGRKRRHVQSRGVGRNTVVPGGKLPRSIVTSKIGSGEFTRRVPI